MLVEWPVWEWLCHQWARDEFKKMSDQNKENRRKQKVNHTSGRTLFVVLMERRNEMVQKMNAKEPEDRTDEAVATIFREVLGHRSGYSRGMGHSVMPESPKLPGVPNEEFEHLAEENAENRKNAEYYQNRLKEIECGFMAMRDHMREYEECVNIRMSEVETGLESQRETRTIP
ncbi:uncharacterized protein LOC121239789 [Juglans microcarpa x Juglans regia]|uniref:uncharacterized protein LOC121239789 n=1 Tax=Juglans microcarpa x Juglans regia TaxID=2249226 RepID=UPI001B7DF6BC|nr:uncharacterized protein LOC121239789 [Juglans microcarpa x Juglans regia]